MLNQETCTNNMNQILLVSVFLSLLLSSISSSAQNAYVEINPEASIDKQVVYENACYIVKESLNLCDSSIQIPKGCTIKFEGGNINNGIVIGNETRIESPIYAIFAADLNLQGTFLASEAYPEWFESDDDAVKIRKALYAFDNVKLTAKRYFLQSVDENGYGIVVPTGHILSGNRLVNNTMSSDQIIDIKKGLSYKAVVALCSNTMISNLTVHGYYVEGAACIGTKEGFQSRLTLERVGASGSYYGFNLQTYLSTLTQCTANYNTTGFYIHGQYNNNDISVEGTSINLSTCYAVDSKKTGYEIAGITYSTMNNCAADGCGLPTSGIISKSAEIGYSYSFSQCNNITVNSCGAEGCLGAVKTYNSKNIIFNSPSFLIRKRKEVEVANDFTLTAIINIRYSAFIEFNYLRINSSDMSKYYSNSTPLLLLYGSASSLPSVIINNGYEGICDSNIKTEGFLSKKLNLLYK